MKSPTKGIAATGTVTTAVTPLNATAIEAVAVALSETEIVAEAEVSEGAVAAVVVRHIVPIEASNLTAEMVGDHILLIVRTVDRVLQMSRLEDSDVVRNPTSIEIIGMEKLQIQIRMKSLKLKA